MSISYILPVWICDEELLKLTKETIKSLRVASKEAQLLIVDNASDTGGDYLQKEADVYIRNKENLGFAVAVRQGWLLATGEVLATVNNDIRIAPNWVAPVLEILEDPIVGMVHPRMTDYDVPFRYGKSIVYRGKERWCTFSCFFLRKSFLGELAQKETGVNEPFPGMLDLNYKYASADWDFNHRVRKAGYRQVYTDKTCYQHKHSSTQERLKDRAKIEYDNKEYFKRKWGKYPEELFLEEFPNQMKQDYKWEFDI